MKTILAGTDFSKSSINACKYAALLAQKLNCKLVIFNLFQTPVYHANSGLMGISLQDLKEDSQNKVEALILSLKKDFPTLPVSALTGSGAFKDALVNYVNKHRVAAVVMGLEAKSRVSKFIWGSHGVSIGGKIDAPVVIVPDRYKDHRLETAVLAVDNREKLQAGILKNVEKLTNDLQVRLNLLHVRTPDEVFSPTEPTRLKIGKTERVMAFQNANTIEAGVQQYSKKNNVDLIGIISRKHSVFYNLFNESVTKRVAFVSKVPVMAIHE